MTNISWLLRTFLPDVQSTRRHVILSRLLEDSYDLFGFIFMILNSKDTLSCINITYLIN